jgi:M-phase phosphoprotein 6
MSLWKPGTPKPTEHDDLKKSPSTPSSAPSKRELSGATMGMRFMQKRIQIEAANNSSPHTTNLEQISRNAIEESPCSNQPSNVDMYGLQSSLIGRRSFGGFKPKINNNWQECLSFITGKDKKGSKRKHISDDELVQRYKELVTNRSDHSKSSKTRKRKKSQERNQRKSIP